MREAQGRTDERRPDWKPENISKEKKNKEKNIKEWCAHKRKR
jgi:hypothetical protein